MTTTSDEAVVIPEYVRAEAAAPALAVEGLTKRFADVLAADSLDIAFHAGEVHAVLGENGAGKSTLMKMLYGFYKPDGGTVSLDGDVVTLHSPADARRLGIGMVFQNFTLIPALSVLENVALLNQTSGISLDKRGLTSRIQELSKRYGLEVNPAAMVRDLSIGEQQRVEILKSLACSPRILILDEPTSVLAPHEVANLLDIVRHLRNDGLAVILITHKLGEVFAVADRVSVLRRGVMVGGGLIGEFDQHSLLTLMLGERAAEEKDPVASSSERGASGLRLQGVSLKTDDGRMALRDVSLEVCQGEIVGIAAVSGNGQAFLGEALLGTGNVTEGTVQIGGKEMTKSAPAARLAAGFAVVPEDPIRDGSVAEMSVRENLSISGAGGWLLRPGEIVRRALAAANRSPFPLPSLTRTLGTLSGGNIQRVVLAREMSDTSSYLLAYYPTRGLDVTSTRAVRSKLIDLKERGGAVLLVSEDLDELTALCDRIVVLHHGEVVGSFCREEVDVMEIGRLMTGGKAA